VIEWLRNNWLSIIGPLLAFFATVIIGLWLKRLVDTALVRWKAKSKWEGKDVLAKAIQRPFLFWFLLLGAIIAIEISVAPADIKTLTVRIIGSVFVLILGFVTLILLEQLFNLYLPKAKAPARTITLTLTILRITFIVVGALILLDIWGAPLTPVLLFIAILVLGIALLIRNTATDFFAGFQLGASQHIKEGDYIKLETGEEGHIIEMSWHNTRLRALDNSVIVIPNSRLLQHKIINYGRPLRKVEEPFRFYTRTNLTELTGLKAKSLEELAQIMKTVPDSVIMYHTHRFLEEHHYLSPEPANDFGVWVTDALGDDALGERLASVNTFEFTSIQTLRERLVGIIEEHLSKEHVYRDAAPGREFYFMKSVSVIFPTEYAAYDLREFIEILRTISLSSLYFHVFESRLRLGMGQNDFSAWVKDKLGEDQLGNEIAALDPYTYTLEGLRLALIQLIEKRIK
jgi:small-conductance mechanosensitive channel